MKRKLLLITLLVASLILTACGATAEKTTINAAFLKGPTGMGAAKLMEDAEAGLTANAYNFSLHGAPDAILAQLVTGELDIAALPTNAIALIAKRSEGGVQALAVNTLGILYVLERGDTIKAASDLADKTIAAAGQGTTVEAVAQRLFPDAQVEYMAEHAEVVTQAVSGAQDIVLLPEPFVTSLLSQDAGFRIALDATAEWEATDAGTLTMGGIAVRRAFAEENPQAIADFLAEYANSISFTTENPEDAAAMIEKFDIMPAAVAAKAIPRANMVLLIDADMREALAGYYAVLMETNAALIGDALPDDAFYYAK